MTMPRPKLTHVAPSAVHSGGTRKNVGTNGALPARVGGNRSRVKKTSRSKLAKAASSPAKQQQNARVPRPPGERPHVAILVDTGGNYGRGLVEGIATYLATHGPWSVYLDPHATGRLDSSWLRSWNGDGILAFIEHRGIEAALIRRGIPVVEMYGHLPDLRLPSICSDDVAIGELAVNHFIQRGLLHFAFTGYPDQPWSARRREGFAAGVKAAGYPCATLDYPRSFKSVIAWERAQERLTEWLARQPRPLGVMACSDRHAQRVLDACRRLKLSVPDEVAVIGVDDDVAICQLADPPLSSVSDNPVKIGYDAAQMLDDLMSRRIDPATIGRVLVPPRCVVARRSTDVKASGDELVADVLRFIREHACQNINVDTLLRKFPSSRSALFRRFRQATGRTMHEEILRVRLEQVQHLLVHTQRPVVEIAYLTGFEHAEYLGAVFKRRMGVSPGGFRNQHRPGAMG